MAIEAEGFAYAPGVTPAQNAKLTKRGTIWPYQFYLGKDISGKEHYVNRYVLEPRSFVLTWVPIDPAFTKVALDARIKAHTTGIMTYRCFWLYDHVITQRCEDAL